MAKSGRKQSKTPSVCPVCGEDVPPSARACPECGADERSGWREDVETYDGLDLGNDDFNYEEFVREEFGSGAKPRGIKTVWWITGIVLLLAFIALCFFAG